MQPEQVAKRGHFLFVAGDGEAGKILRRRSEGGVGEHNASEENDQSFHVVENKDPIHRRAKPRNVPALNCRGPLRGLGCKGEAATIPRDTSLRPKRRSATSFPTAVRQLPGNTSRAARRKW